MIKEVFKVEPNNKFMSYYKREILFIYGLSCEEREEYKSDKVIINCPVENRNA